MRIQGDNTFEESLVRHMPDLKRYAVSLCGQVLDPDDLVQETLRKALAYRDRYEIGTDIRAWLFAMQFNAYRTMTRSHVRLRARETHNPDAIDMFPTLPNQFDYLLFSQAEDLIEKLPRDQKQALYCVVFDNMSYQQAAVALACSEGTVKSRLSRARAALLEMVNEPEPEAQLAELSL